MLLFQIIPLHGEIFTLHGLCCFHILLMEIHHIHGFVHMKFPKFTVFVAAFIIIQPVGYIRTLLDFADEHAWSDGMDSSGLDEVTLALLYRDFIEDFCQSAVLNPLPYLCLVRFFGKSTVKIGIRLAVHHIPEFIFAVFVFFLQSVIIPRMDLNRQALTGIDKFDQQWKPLIGFAFPAKDAASKPVDIFAQHETLTLSCGNHALARFVSGQFPALCDHIIITFLTIDITQTGTTPQVIFECRFQTDQFITVCFHHRLAAQPGQVGPVPVLQLTHADLDND